MLISDSKRFIFVHVPKTAGSSLRELLRPHSNARRKSLIGSVLRPLGLPRDHRRFCFLTHGPLKTAQRIMDEETFRSYFKFAFVRNPWDRLVSEYNALMHKPGHRRYARVAKLGGFAGYLKYEAPRVAPNQVELLLNLDGQIGVDFIGRFERLNEDVRAVCERLGIPCDLPHVNGHPHAEYRQFYDEQTREYVRKHWARDIEAFGYEF